MPLVAPVRKKEPRVLYSFPGRLGTPGIGTTAWHQIDGLADLGVRLCVYCGSCERPLHGVEGLIETMKLGSWRVPYRLVGNDRASRLHDRRVARGIEAHPDAVDLVHCWPLGALETFRTARRLRISTVLERPNTHTRFAYNVVAEECRKLAYRLPKRSSHSFNARRLAWEEQEYSLADRLLCPSDFVMKSFLDLRFPKEQLALHQYGYDPRRFSPPPSRPPPRPNSLTAAFVGTKDPRKGLHYALEAWLTSGAADTGRFYVCGDCAPGFRAFLEPWLRHPSIVEVGYHCDVASVMRRADILIVPSIEEGSALVTYEARACGCVLLVSDATGARCEHMHDGLVHHAGDIKCLRDQIRMLAQDRTLCERLREASLRGIGELTWSAAAGRLYGIYSEMIGRSFCPLVHQHTPRNAVSKTTTTATEH